MVMANEPWTNEPSQLLFRRQFVIGPRFLDGFPKWKRMELRSGIHLTTHPELTVSHVRGEDASVTVLGFILDPLRVEDRDPDILKRLLRHLEGGGTRESLIRLTYPLAGRWILLVEAGRERWLFNDPCGHRQVFYAEPPQPRWCATQPGLLAAILGLSMNRETARYYRTYRRRDPQYSWPGDTSPFPGIRRLQPNHLLDLRTGGVGRYWPEGDVAPRSFDEVVAENARLLKGIVEGASRRFGLSLGITAGRDTRTLLAASRAIRDRLYCFTSLSGHMDWRSSDIRLPSKLLAQFRLPHHVVVCPSHMDKRFERIYRASVVSAHDCYGPIVQGELQGHPEERVCMLGIGMPILKVVYRGRLRRWRPMVDVARPDDETFASCA